MPKLKQTTQEEIELLEREKSSWLNLIKVTRSERDNPAHYERSLAELDATIATLQKRRAELVDRHENADRIIVNAQQKAALCKKKITRLSKERDIDRMLDLVRLIGELGGEVPK